MQQTINFKLNLPEGTDLFAPMHDYNPNWSAIDNQMQLNRLNSMQEADCIFAGGVFQLTRKVKGSTFFRFTAPADYTAGNTFTIDGEVFTAGLAGTFATLPDGVFANGNIVVVYLDDGDTKKMSLMTGASPLPKDLDAKTLDGHGVEYFATTEALATVNATATAAGNQANSAITSAQGKTLVATLVWSNANPTEAFAAQSIKFDKPVPPEQSLRAIIVGFKPETAEGDTSYGPMIWGGGFNAASNIPYFARDSAGNMLILRRQISVVKADSLFMSSAMGMSFAPDGQATPLPTMTNKMIPMAIYAIIQR